MEYQQKIVLLVVVLLVALAIYFTITIEMPVTEEANTTEVKELLLKGMEFGKGLNEYTYAYTDVSDGYRVGYVIAMRGNDSSVEVTNPLSYKKIYFLSNDTILCIEYPPGDEACSSVQNNDRVKNYITSISVKFFNDTRIEKNINDLNYLISNNYIILHSEITNKSKCREITYTLDYSNASVMDAARFGIGATTPKVFEWTMCINNDSGYVYEKSFTYNYSNMEHYYEFELNTFSKYAGLIMPPENLSGGAVNAFEKEREQQIKLANCYTTKQGNERDKCISDLALTLKRKDMCELADGRRDRCFISLVPITKDETVCPLVTDLAFKDDCYIELAGAYKNTTYCENIQNESKLEFCMEVGTPVDTGNESGNNESIDPLEILNYIENHGTQNNETEE
ncbi:hypothetical protein KKB44_02690 [Candidatus Micrarchaeota archaeon]|nr:hypothetical protein [Candidatus Micrarchaeota archaeon]